MRQDNQDILIWHLLIYSKSASLVGFVVGLARFAQSFQFAAGTQDECGGVSGLEGLA
jgi:hypothetical protein